MKSGSEPFGQFLSSGDDALESSEALTLTPEDQEMKASDNMIIEEIRKDGWYCRDTLVEAPEKIADNAKFTYVLFEDAKRKNPTVFGLHFGKSIEYKRYKNRSNKGKLSTQDLHRLRNRALFDFLNRVYREHHQQTPPPGIIEDVLIYYHQSLMGQFEVAAQAVYTSNNPQYAKPNEHSNTISYRADLTMDSKGAYFDVTADIEAIRLTDSTIEHPFRAIPGRDTTVSHRFRLIQGEGFQLERVRFGSLFLKKLCLQSTLQEEDWAQLIPLQATGKIQGELAQEMRQRKYEQAYLELSVAIDNTPFPEVKKTATRVWKEIQKSKTALGNKAPLLTMTSALRTTKNAITDPTPATSQECRRLAQKLNKRPWSLPIAAALTDLALVTMAMALLPWVLIASVPVTLGVGIYTVTKVAQGKPAALPPIKKLSLFYHAVRKKPVSRALDKFANKIDNHKA